MLRPPPAGELHDGETVLAALIRHQRELPEQHSFALKAVQQRLASTDMREWTFPDLSNHLLLSGHEDARGVVKAVRMDGSAFQGLVDRKGGCPARWPQAIRPVACSGSAALGETDGVRREAVPWLGRFLDLYFVNKGRRGNYAGPSWLRVSSPAFRLRVSSLQFSQRDAFPGDSAGMDAIQDPVAMVEYAVDDGKTSLLSAVLELMQLPKGDDFLSSMLLNAAWNGNLKVAKVSGSTDPRAS